MSVINRLFLYFEQKEIPHTAFEKRYGLSNGYLQRQKKNQGQINEKALFAVVENCIDLNLHWLITGKGEMLKALPRKAFNDKDTSIGEEIMNRIIDLEKRVLSLENVNPQ